MCMGYSCSVKRENHEETTEFSEENAILMGRVQPAVLLRAKVSEETWELVEKVMMMMMMMIRVSHVLQPSPAF